MNNEMLCKCCNLEVEVKDSAKLCHYCYLRDCGSNPGKCDNALTDWSNGQWGEDGKWIDHNLTPQKKEKASK